MDISNPVIKDDINQMIDTAVIKSFEKQEISDKDDAKQEIDDQLNDDFKHELKIKESINHKFESKYDKHEIKDEDEIIKNDVEDYKYIFQNDKKEILILILTIKIYLINIII